jgi:hypothetical protein
MNAPQSCAICTHHRPERLQKCAVVRLHPTDPWTNWLDAPAQENDCAQFEPVRVAPVPSQDMEVTP